MNNQKYIVMTFLGAAVLVGFSVRGVVIPLLAKFETGDIQVLGFITVSALLGFLSAIATFMVLNRHPLAFSFTDESITELRKTAWPDKEETVRSATVVIIFTLIVAGALGGYDFIWARLTNIFLFTEG